MTVIRQIPCFCAYLATSAPSAVKALCPANVRSSFASNYSHLTIVGAVHEKSKATDGGNPTSSGLESHCRLPGPTCRHRPALGTVGNAGIPPGALHGCRPRSTPPLGWSAVWDESSRSYRYRQG